jgi:L-rhamnose isomerase
MSFAISEDFIAAENARHAAALVEDYEALGRQLARRGISI